MNVNPFYSDFKRKKIFNIDKPTQLKILEYTKWHSNTYRGSRTISFPIWEYLLGFVLCASETQKRKFWENSANQNIANLTNRLWREVVFRSLDKMNTVDGIEKLCCALGASRGSHHRCRIRSFHISRFCLYVRTLWKAFLWRYSCRLSSNSLDRHSGWCHRNNHKVKKHTATVELDVQLSLSP